MKILLCFGTRPEAIKLAPVIQELITQKLDYKVCVTAQHREMLDQVLDFFEIIPDYDLDLMQPNQSLNLLSGKILNAIDRVLEIEKPTIVLVQGDTTSAAMVALAAFHQGIKVGHIEAGLRTYNKLAPFPEEVNRQFTARITDYHFAPTEKAKTNLLNEKIDEADIFTTGNTIVDALEWAIEKMECKPVSEEILKIKSLFTPDKKIILVTGHRRENFGEGLINICEALIELSKMKDVEIIFPVHLNPNVSTAVHELLGNINNIHLISPVAYPSMLWLMKNCSLIISDSGGIQEEAPTFKKPVLVTREVSERIEGVEAGFSVLVGTNKHKIILEAQKLINNPPDFKDKNNPYGDGEASKRIIKELI